MTRINVIDVTELADQHLMAEYRELPMVFASARRSNPAKYIPADAYTLNTGHVKYFFNKKKYLLNRWLDIIEELYHRKYKIDPSSRTVHWNSLDKFSQIDWNPTDQDKVVNLQRLQEKISQKPSWYRYHGKPFPSNSVVV